MDRVSGWRYDSKVFFAMSVKIVPGANCVREEIAQFLEKFCAFCAVFRTILFCGFRFKLTRVLKKLRNSLSDAIYTWFYLHNRFFFSFLIFKKKNISKQYKCVSTSPFMLLPTRGFVSRWTLWLLPPQWCGL